MDWNIWDSSYSYDQGFYSSQIGHEFVDVIEEDALNEKSCIQVLKNLIAKEDKEIEELEKDLSSLQSELAFVERPGFYIHDLTQRIEKLKSSSILKDECADKSSVNSLSSSHQTPEKAVVKDDGKLGDPQRAKMCGKKKPTIKKESKVDGDHESEATQALNPDRLRKMTLLELREMAKQQNMKGTSKLKKGCLVEKLLLQLSSS